MNDSVLLDEHLIEEVIWGHLDTWDALDEENNIKE